MKSIHSISLVIVIITFLATIFFVFSDFILPGGDKKIGLLQLSAIASSLSILLCASDFSFFWPRQQSLTLQDWGKSALLFLTGTSLLAWNNILLGFPTQGKEGFDWGIKVFAHNSGALLVLAGLCWRYQYSLMRLASWIRVRTENRVAHFKKLDSRWFYILPAAFLLAGMTIAFREVRSHEVIIAPFRFLFLCAVSVLTGQGLINLLLGKDQPLAINLLAPVAGVTVWAIGLGIGVGLHIPVRLLSIPLWGVTIYLAWHGSDRKVLQSAVPYIVAAFTLALAATFTYILNGFSNYMGSPFLDGWSYVAYGQYLWEYPRGLEGGLQPLFQYASHLSRTRFVGSSLLGFFSVVTGTAGNTHAAFGFFFPFVFFVYASSLFSVALTRFSTGFSRYVFILCVVLSGWSFTVLKANNLDHGLALAFFPALAVLVAMSRLSQVRWVLILALITGACIYIYPEMASFIIVSAGLLFLERVLSEKLPPRDWLLGGLIAVLLVVIVLLPYLSELINFMLSQFAAASRGVLRPGRGTAPELLDYRYVFFALWGMGGSLDLDSSESFWLNVRTTIALLLSILTGLGIFRQLRNRRVGSFIILVFFISLALYYIFFAHYDYAAYKILSISSWFIIAVIVEELQVHLQTKRKFVRVALKTAFVGITVGLVAVFIVRINNFAKSFPFTSVAPFRQLEAMPVPRDTPLLVSINDTIPNEWAMYYLRTRPILLYPYRGYANQSHVIPLMERSAPLEITRIKLILTERNPPFPQPFWKILWENEVYALWELPDEWFHIIVNNPNGIEAGNAPVQFWLGTEETFLDILTTNEGVYTLILDIVQGPSLPEITTRQVRVTDTSGQMAIYTWEDGRHNLIVPLVTGKNRISLQVLDKPTMDRLPNGDTRKLLLGIRSVQIGKFSK